jgi:alpha-L-fucosidase 2
MGSVKGLRARGGYEVDESWRDGKISILAIRSIVGRAVVVPYWDKAVTVDLHPGEAVTLGAELTGQK